MKFQIDSDYIKDDYYYECLTNTELKDPVCE